MTRSLFQCRLFTVFSVPVSCRFLSPTAQAAADAPVIYTCRIIHNDDIHRFTIPGFASWGADKVAQLVAKAMPHVKVRCD